MWFGHRIIPTNGKLPALEPQLDEKTGVWMVIKALTTLRTVWQDPEFNPAQKAFCRVHRRRLPNMPARRRRLGTRCANSGRISDSGESLFEPNLDYAAVTGRDQY